MTPAPLLQTLVNLADSADPYGDQISLMHGWVPTTVQGLAAATLVAAIGWRSRRWRRLWLPVAFAVGAALVGATHWYVISQGLSGDPAPPELWIWTALTGAAVAVAALGWRATRWWRRGASGLAVTLCALSSALALNLWVGYLPTVQTAWGQLTAAPLPDQADAATVIAIQRRGVMPAAGTVVSVNIGNAASGFRHRSELVYLPPAWFASNPPPKLPVVMMIGGEFNTPADWLRAGNAVAVMDRFAAAHRGNAPVLVFVDAGGAFNNDTECVNGPRGNSADHLTKDVVPFMIAHYGVSADRANWGAAGWSMGGTCAVDLAVMHPELFSSFLDIDGDLGPNTGTKAQTVARLYGGSSAAWAAFDPPTVIAAHGRYDAVSGWFAVSGRQSAPRHPVNAAGAAVGLGARISLPGSPGDQASAANTLCQLGSDNGIDCAVVPEGGKHDWPFAARAFAASLPWIAGRVGTPSAPAIGFPDPQPAAAPATPRDRSAPSVQASGR